MDRKATRDELLSMSLKEAMKIIEQEIVDSHIVRCKDCVHLSKSYQFGVQVQYCEKLSTPDGDGCLCVSDDFFCGYGERKEG